MRRCRLAGKYGNGGSGGGTSFCLPMKIIQSNSVFYWLPVLMLCVLIFVQSSFPSPDFGPSAFPLKDKVLHMAAYGVLAALFSGPAGPPGQVRLIIGTIAGDQCMLCHPLRRE
jgi:hypothetical protein